MDSMIQSYMEETEDMLQKAEECIIRLEMEYSEPDVNELFRIAHTIKGSSHMVGYEDIGNLMHKIEDMLDCVRNGSIIFDQSIVHLCFEGLDVIKKILQCKEDLDTAEIMESLVEAAQRTNEMIQVFIKVNKKEAVIEVIKQPEIGIISSKLNQPSIGKNKYYVTFFFEEDVPMVSPIILMILNSVEDIGTLVFSSVGDNYFSGNSDGEDLKTFDMIISTDADEAELYTYFALFYIERINIVDLSRSMVAENDHNFLDIDDSVHILILKAFMQLYKIGLSLEPKINSEELDLMKYLKNQVVNEVGGMKNNYRIDGFLEEFSSLYGQIIKIHDGQVELNTRDGIVLKAQLVKLIEKAFNHIKGKRLISIFKAEKNNFISRLQNFIGMLNKTSTLILLIDVSQLNTLDENEVKDLIAIKKQMESQSIEIGIIVMEFGERRIINIFDSIKQVEDFQVSKSGIDAILSIFDSNDTLQRISKSLKAG